LTFVDIFPNMYVCLLIHVTRRLCNLIVSY